MFGSIGLFYYLQMTDDWFFFRLVIDLSRVFPSLLLQNFAKEFMFSDLKDLDEENIRNELKKAGGANYDAQAE